MNMEDITVGQRVRLLEDVERDVATAPGGATGTVTLHDPASDDRYGLISVQLDEPVDGLTEFNNEIQWSGLGIGMHTEYLQAGNDLETI